MTNILFVTHNDNFQGSSRSLLDLLEGLKGYDLFPLVANPLRSAFTRTLQSKGIPCEITPLPWWVKIPPLSLKEKFEKTLGIYLGMLGIKKIIKKQEINIVYTNNLVTPVGLLAARLTRVPHVWHIREFGDLDFSLHFIFPKWICQRLIKKSSAIICNSFAVRDYVFGNVTNNKIHVIYNGVAFKKQFDQRLSLAQEKTKKNVYTFLVIGSISPKKGQELAIRALSVLKNNGLGVRLRVVGPGRASYIEHCSNLASFLSVSEFIDFEGFQIDPTDAFLSSDCLLMCSENEAFGRVTAEAMSACLPVIGRNSGGTPELIVDGETGFLFKTFEQLVESMITLVRNPELGRKMGMTGWQRAREIFNIEGYAANVYKVIQSVMDKK